MRLSANFTNESIFLLAEAGEAPPSSGPGPGPEGRNARAATERTPSTLPRSTDALPGSTYVGDPALNVLVEYVVVLHHNPDMLAVHSSHGY